MSREEMARERLDLIRLASIPSLAEAGMILELLRNNGVNAVLQGANFGGLEPLSMPGGFSEIRILVPATEESEARHLYEAFFATGAVDPDFSPSFDEDLDDR